MTQPAAPHPPRHPIGALQYLPYFPTEYQSTAVAVVVSVSEEERILFVLQSRLSRLKDLKSSYQMKNLRGSVVRSLRVCVVQMIFFFSSKIPLEVRELPLSQLTRMSYC